jgi:hypothetical protein
MKPKIHEMHMDNFDFASLYPTTMKVHNIKPERKLFRREKIERLTKKINDKRTDQELPTE